MECVDEGASSTVLSIFCGFTHLPVESFPITGRTVCRDGMIPKTGFLVQTWRWGFVLKPLCQMREGGLWVLQPSALPHLTPYIDVLRSYSSVLQSKRKSWVRRVGFFVKRAWQVCCVAARGSRATRRRGTARAPDARRCS